MDKTSSLKTSFVLASIYRISGKRSPPNFVTASSFCHLGLCKIMQLHVSLTSSESRVIRLKHAVCILSTKTNDGTSKCLASSLKMINLTISFEWSYMSSIMLWIWLDCESRVSWWVCVRVCVCVCVWSHSGASKCFWTNRGQCVFTQWGLSHMYHGTSASEQENSVNTLLI